MTKIIRSLIVGYLAFMALPSNAATMSENGLFIARDSNEFSHSLLYSFSPINIPGDITSASFTFNGTIFPGAAIVVNDGTLLTATMQPMVHFGVDGNFGILNMVLPMDGKPGVALPITEPFVAGTNSPGKTEIGNFAPINTTGNITITSGLSTALSETFFTEVDLFSKVLSTTGTAYISGADISDASYGNGSVIMTIDYTPVIEPGSIALLGVGLFGFGFVANRKRFVA